MYKLLQFEDGESGYIQCDEVTEEGAGIFIAGALLLLVAGGSAAYDKIRSKLDKEKYQKLKEATEKISKNPNLKNVCKKLEGIKNVSDKLNAEIVSKLKKLNLSDLKTVKKVDFSAETYSDYLENNCKDFSEIVSNAIMVSQKNKTLTIELPTNYTDVTTKTGIDEYIEDDEDELYKRIKPVFEEVCKKYSNNEYEFDFDLWADGDHDGNIGMDYNTYMSVTVKNVDLSAFQE